MKAFSALTLLASLAATLGAATMTNDISDQYKAGEHKGEKKQLAVDIQFSGASGTTTTNGSGIFYSFYGVTLSEPKVYPQEYWGTVPLYFFGQTVGATVTVSNLGPRASIKLRITSQAYVMKTDGSSGVRLAEDRVSEITLGKGETRSVDASFSPQFVAGADSGLDRVVILVQHVNEGGGPGNEYPALILAKEAILCPPAVQAKAGK